MNAPYEPGSLARANVLFTLGVALLVAMGLASWLSLRQADRADELRVQTYQVMDKLNEARAELLEMQTGARGFALLGMPEFLETYEAGRGAVAPSLAAVRALTVDSPVQQRSVVELETCVQECLARSELVVRTRREDGPEAARKLVSSGDGKRIMDAARSVLARMQAEELRLLALHDADSRRAGKRVFVLTTVARLAAIALFAVAFLSYRREYRRRSAAEAGMRQSNTELEQRVTERTAELTQANAQLGQGLNELGRTEAEVRRLLDAAEESRRALLSGVEDQRRTEKALRESEARFRALIEHSHDAIALFGADGDVLYSSPSLTRILGYLPGELDHQNALEFVHPDWQAATREKLAESLRQPGVAIPAEGCVRHKDGSWRFLEGTLTNLLHEPGIGAIINNFRDITERKRADEMLRAQHTELENLYATTPVGLALIDRDLRYVRINQRLAAINGKPVAAHIGRTIREALPELAPVLVPIYRRVLDGGEPVLDIEVHGATPAEPDVMRDWLASYHPLRGADGSVSGISVAVMSITAQKRAEAALRETQRQLTSLIANLPGAVYRCRNDRNWTTEFVSEGVLQLLGYAAADFMEHRREIGQSIHPDDQGRVWEGVQTALRERRRYELTYRITTASGEEKWLSEQGAGVFDASGTFQALEGFAMDITERKQAEEALRHSRGQLRALIASLHRAREEERARVSREIHDELGQLLTGLKMDVRWLERKLSNVELPPALTPLLERAVAASELADATIVTVQRIAADLRPGALDTLGLNAALKQKARGFQDRTGVACVLVAEAGCPEVPPLVASELFYICQEALTNVTRHAQATSVEIHLRAEGDVMVLEVRDDGVGMAEWDSNAPRSLGLLGMKERAGQCGGTVTFERNEPRGTRVVVRVPGERDGDG